MKTLIDHITEILLLAFLTITFLQSGLDKVIDWKGNLGWLKGHFSKTVFKSSVPFLLFLVTLVELTAGILSLIGIPQFLFYEHSSLGLWGAIASCVALLMLLFGQRVAKDYEGAKTIAIYFIPAVFAVFLLSM